MNPDNDITYPYKYATTAPIGELRARFDSLEPGEETSEKVRVAGRAMTVRGQGKAGFADLRDSTGRIQLFARSNVIGEEGMESFKAIGVGDIVGAEGEVMMTRRGELSINVRSVTLLAPALRPMPDTFHGIANVETRYRQRYLDLLLTDDARRAVDGRAKANAAIRSFLDARGFVEVETPLLHPVASGATARPFKTHHNALGIDLFLRVAPELYLKRLLIGGLDRVYELNRSFRNEGVSSQHNPEFTMLEAYEAYVDYDDTMALVEELVRAIAFAVTGGYEFAVGGQTIDLAEPFRRMTMFEAVTANGGPDLLDVWKAGDYDAITSEAENAGIQVDAKWPPGKVLAEIFESIAERKLLEPTFVVGYPMDVSPLVKE
ncbi:MAG: lysine--tRNA ligase, partial [Actinomycetota bacterium]